MIIIDGVLYYCIHVKRHIQFGMCNPPEQLLGNLHLGKMTLASQFSVLGPDSQKDTINFILKLL